MRNLDDQQACGHRPQGDQPQNRRATVPTVGGHQPKNWTGTALLFNLDRSLAFFCLGSHMVLEVAGGSRSTSRDFFRYLHVQGLVVLWCLCWVSEFAVSAGFLHWPLSSQLLQCSGQPSQVTNTSTGQHASTVLSTRSFQVALRPVGDQFRVSPFCLSEILEQPMVLRSWFGWYSTRARST